MYPVVTASFVRLPPSHPFRLTFILLLLFHLLVGLPNIRFTSSFLLGSVAHTVRIFNTRRRGHSQPLKHRGFVLVHRVTDLVRKLRSTQIVIDFPNRTKCTLHYNAKQSILFRFVMVVEAAVAADLKG
jgi:hypothetical protein